MGGKQQPLAVPRFKWRFEKGLKQHLQKAFTLIEVLVVMVLLGIIMSIAVLSIGNSQSDQLEEDMRRLLQIMRLAQEEAVIRQQTLAVKFSPHGYALQRLDNVRRGNNTTGNSVAGSNTGGNNTAGNISTAKKNVWIPLAEPAFFLPKILDEDYEIKLLQDGFKISLNEEEGGMVLMYSSGEMTPFELVVNLPDSEIKYRLTGNLIGELEIEDLQAYGSNAEEEEQ